MLVLSYLISDLRLVSDVHCIVLVDSRGNPRCITNSKGKKRHPNSKDLAQSVKSTDAQFLDFMKRCLEWVWFLISVCSSVSVSKSSVSFCFHLLVFNHPFLPGSVRVRFCVKKHNEKDAFQLLCKTDCRFYGLVLLPVNSFVNMPLFSFISRSLWYIYFCFHPTFFQTKPRNLRLWILYFIYHEEVHTVTPRCNAVVGRHLSGPPCRRGALWDFTGRFIRHRYPKATSPQVPNVPSQG